jgi:dTDP-4-dehydrorhamnose 3,5-epimerase
MPFEFKQLDIEGLILIQPASFFDERGYFLELFRSSEFIKYGIKENFTQDNFSSSKKNVLRGLHYQVEPCSQGKLMNVLRGRALDITVDIRKSSKTFKKWISVELSGENRNILYVPPGLAHGFLALTDDVCFLYKCTKEYSQHHENGIRWDDPELAINWQVKNPLISAKDMNLPLFKDSVIFE